MAGAVITATSQQEGWSILHVLISPLGFFLGPPAASHSPKSYICAMVELLAVNWPEMCVCPYMLVQ